MEKLDNKEIANDALAGDFFGKGRKYYRQV